MAREVVFADVCRQISQFGDLATLVTVTAEETPHAVTVLVGVAGDRLIATVGERTRLNLVARPVDAAGLARPRLVGVDHVRADCAAEGEFSVWRVPGRKSLKHEGARLRLAAQIGHRVLRIVLPQPWLDGSPAAFCVPTGAQVHRRVRAVKAILSLLQRQEGSVFA